MSNLFFITGAEGVGKSTILSSLKDSFPNMDAHDFDENGVPENPPLKWRHDTTLHWINIAIKNQQENKSTIISGLSFPSEVEMYEESRAVDNILFCLLDIKEKEREKRLGSRNAPQDQIGDLRQLHKLRKDFKKTSLDNIIIDTTDMSIKDVADKVINWIESKSK